MKHAKKIDVFAAVLIAASSLVFAEPSSLALRDTIGAIDAYENGFVYNVMRTPGGDAVMLNDMELVEDDGPGSGNSEKGTWTEELYRGILVRKTFNLEDARAFEAHLVFYMTPKNPDTAKQKPFYVIVNGERFEGPPLSWHENMWHWLKIPVKTLKSGENTVVIGCDAPKGEGYDLMIARADEYEAGGAADPKIFSPQAKSGELEYEMDEQSGKIRFLSVGKNSAKSFDGGKNWIRMKLGTTNDVIGEYTVRLKLKRYTEEGSLLSGAIDLWDAVPGYEKLHLPCSVDALKLQCLGDTVQGTSIDWLIRFSDTPDMTGSAWGDFESIGSGDTVSANIGRSIKRYFQWKAVLKTDTPLTTPIVNGVTLSKTLTYSEPANRFYVWDYENADHKYPSVEFSYESWNHPKLQILRKRMELDRVIGGAVSDWDVINRVRHHVSQQWHHGSPMPDYPEWDALEILDRRDRVGKGGMCIQFSVVFIQCLESLGYQARHINMFAHETVEVYVDELGKWVHLDPESVFDSYEYNTDTGIPVNCVEQHRYFLQESGLTKEHPIDWQSTKPWTVWGSRGTVTGRDVPLDFSTYTGWINNPSQPDYPPQHRLAGFLRMMPRNDYFSNPYPRPLSQGSSNWPWNGYLNWYDDATPRKLQYSRHSDRIADFYPTLNRVQFDTILNEESEEVSVSMFTVAPNFDGFEINIDGNGWKKSPPEFRWKLNRSSLNTLEMRVANKLGPKGKESKIQVMYHYKEPFKPRPSDW